MGILSRSLIVVFALVFVQQVASQCDIKTGSFTPLGLSATLGFYNLSQINLKVCPMLVQGSIPGYVQLANGTFDVFTGTLTDNAFSRFFDPKDYNQTIVMLGESALNSAGTVFGSRWNITKFEEFKGTNILVDSPTSGFILTFRRVLAFYGLFYERGDFNLIPLGANRFPALQQGWAYINGVNYSIAGTVISPPQGINLLYDPNFYAPQVRSLGALTDYVLPLSGGSPQTVPDRINSSNPLRPKIVKLLAALILANRFGMNPANKPYLLAQLAAANPNTTAAYVSLTYDYTYGNLSGLSYDFTFNRYGLLNTAYIRQQFGGIPFNTTDYADILTNGTGHLINYGPRDDALTIVNAISNINVNISSSDADYRNSCAYPSENKYINISGLVTGLKARVSGGCLSPQNITVTLTSCTSNSTYFYPAQCVYNAAIDLLRFNGNLDSSESARYYFINYSITEPCGGSTTLTTTIVLYATKSDAPSNCIDISSEYGN